MLERFPDVALAMRQGRFSALSDPDDWDITPAEAFSIRDYIIYVLAFYRTNLCGTQEDLFFFEQTLRKVDAMLAGGGWLWSRPSALEQDIDSGVQRTLDIA